MPFPLSKRRRRLESAHFRHLKAHQDQIVVLLLQGSKCITTIEDRMDDVPPLVEKPGREALVHRIIFSQQYVQGPRWRECALK